MDPIARISPTRSGPKPVPGPRPLDRVERDERRPEDDDQQPDGRRQAPREPRPGVVTTDGDGVPHVDVQA